MSDQTFYDQIRRFNELYRLPSNETPTLLGEQRLLDFMDILNEEVQEGEDIHEKYQQLKKDGGGDLTPEARTELLTDISDWLGDIIVYCASEARRWGIPLNQVLDVIMESNFSKLGADGKPIYDDRGKVMKGPDYWKPEPKIRELLDPQI